MRALRDGAIVAGLLFAGYLFVVVAPSAGTFGFDAFAYWSLDLAGPYARTAGALGAFTYSPVIARLFAPFGMLAFSQFLLLWSGLLVGTAAWLGLGSVRSVLAVFAFPAVALELYHGNVHLLMAAAIWLGFRYPVAWSFVLLTKVTPGVGLAWFVVRREWRSLAIALGVTAALVVISLAIDGRLWESAPQLVRRQVYAAVRERLPHIVEEIITDVGEHIEELLDLEHLVVSRLRADKALLNRLFLDSGKSEFKLLIDCGYYFGFFFGLLQLGWWIIYPAPWTLAAAGLVHGWMTNYLALNLVFRPLHPIKIGPWQIQGLFLRRQKEVAGIWCHMVTREILTIRALMRSMLTGPRADRAAALIRGHLKPLVEEAIAAVGPIAQVAVSAAGVERIQEQLSTKALGVSADPFEDEAFNEERAVVVERLLRDRMEHLPPEEFQDLLRPCFKEDEWTLLALGSVVGFIVGVLQHLIFFRG